MAEFPIEMEHPEVEETILAFTAGQLEAYRASGWTEKRKTTREEAKK